MHRYSMLIEWSDDDQAFIVTLPEWEEQAGLIGHTHGQTYTEAVEKGQELLALLIEDQSAENKPLPMPRAYAKGA